MSAIDMIDLRRRYVPFEIRRVMSVIPTTRQLAEWLQAHAARGGRRATPPPEERITRSAWFQREHRKLDAAVWSLPSVKSPANCGACHTQAERGRFDEHGLRAPAGLDARQRRAFED